MSEHAAGGGELEGRYQPEGADISHHEGFHRALENALENHDWPGGDHEARVRHYATVRVTNPGVIHEYIVRVSRGA